MNPPAAGTSQFKRLSVLIAVAFVDMIGLMMVIPLLPFVATDLGASPMMLGVLTSAFPVAQLLSAPSWGRVSDRYGRRPALLIGLIASMLAYVVFGAAHTIWLLLVSRLVQGAGGGTTGVLNAYVADSIEPADRAKALGWLSAATSAGVVVGPAIASGAAHFGQAAPGYFAALLCAINAFFAWKWLPESRKQLGQSTAPKPVWHAASEILRHPTGLVPSLIWIYAGGMLAFTCLTALLGLYLKDEFQATATTIGSYYSYIGVLSVLIRAVGLGPAIKYLGELRGMRLGVVLLIAGMVLYPSAQSVWQLILVMPLVPMGTALIFPTTTSLMSRYSDPSEIGMTMGVAQTYGGLARVVAPLLAAFMYQKISHASPFFLGAGLVALVGVIAVRLNPGPVPGPTPIGERA
ncbi:MAG: MFS transporter [Gemmatimonadota bacterium]